MTNLCLSEILHSTCKIRFIQQTFFTVWWKKHVVFLCKTYYTVTKETARKVDLFALYVLSTKKTGNHSWENILQYKLLSETSMQLHIPHAICLRLEYNNDIVFQLFFFYIFSHLVIFPLLPPPPSKGPNLHDIHYWVKATVQRISQQAYSVILKIIISLKSPVVIWLYFLFFPVSEDNELVRIILVKSGRDAANCWHSLLSNQYSADPWIFNEMEKKLTLERFQKEVHES